MIKSPQDFIADRLAKNDFEAFRKANEKEALDRESQSDPVVKRQAFIDRRRVEELAYAGAPLPLAVQLIGMHKDRTLKLPKDLRLAAEDCVTIAAAGKELTTAKREFGASMQAVRETRLAAFGDAAASGTPLVEWSEPEVAIPQFSAEMIETAIQGAIDRKRRVEGTFTDLCEYDTLYDLMLDTFDRVVLFAHRPDFNKAEISAVDWEEQVDRAITMATTLRALNVSFVPDEYSKFQRRSVEAFSIEHQGIVHIFDLFAYQEQRIEEDQVRVAPGDPDPTEIDFSEVELELEETA